MDSSGKLLINTGNILSLNELKKKAGINPRDELIETLKIVRLESGSGDTERINGQTNEIIPENIERKDLKMTVKVFIASIETDMFEEALHTVFELLHTDTIESLVLSYDKSESVVDKFEALKKLWTVIEVYVNRGKLSSIGVSDVDTDMFINLFNWANVKPNIIQINLDTCCVVPPALQVFAKEHDVQLLTHNDPCQILPKSAVDELFGVGASLNWAVRYMIHLKCRGVLSTKGYLVKITPPKN